MSSTSGGHLPSGDHSDHLLPLSIEANDPNGMEVVWNKEYKKICSRIL